MEPEPNQPTAIAPSEFDFQNPNAVPEVETHPDSLANGFLNEVDPEHRPIVEAYVKKWDSGVTKKFQSIHDQYKPFKEMGNFEDVQAAWQLAQQLNNDPAGTLKRAIEVYRQHGIELDMSDFMTPEEPEVPENNTNVPEYSGLDPKFLEEWNQVKGVMQVVAQDILERRQSQEVEKQRTEFDNFVKGLHDKHGDFDDHWVATRIGQGVAPDDAVGQFKKMIESYANSQMNNPAPNIFPGTGSSPGQVKDVDIKSLTGEQRRAYIAAAIAAGNAQ